MNSGSHRALAHTARVTYLDALSKGLGVLVRSAVEGARNLAAQSSEPAMRQKRQDLVLDLPKLASTWQAQLDRHIQDALRLVRAGQPLHRVGQPLPTLSTVKPVDTMWALVEDKVMEQDLCATRLAQSVGDQTTQTHADLSARLLAVGEPIQPESVAAGQEVIGALWPCRALVTAWLDAGLTIDQWHVLSAVLQREVAQWVEQALAQANALLRDHGVRPELNLRPFIKRARDPAMGRWSSSGMPGDGTDSGVLGLADDSATGQLSTASGVLGQAPGLPVGPGSGISVTPGLAASSSRTPLSSHAPGSAFAPTLLGGPGMLGNLHDETRLMTQQPLARNRQSADALLKQLNAAVSRQVPLFAQASAVAPLTQGRLLLTDAQGTVWSGSALTVLAGASGSRDASVLPSRLHWSLRPAGLGLTLTLQQAGHIEQPLQLRWQAGWSRQRVELVGGPGVLARWPAAWLEGLGAPLNTLKPGGELLLSSPGLVVTLDRDGWSAQGQAALELQDFSSRLSSLAPLGSYRLQLSPEGERRLGLQLATTGGALLLSGRGHLSAQIGRAHV